MHVQADRAANPMATGCTAEGWLNYNAQGLGAEKRYAEMEKTF